MICKTSKLRLSAVTISFKPFKRDERETRLTAYRPATPGRGQPPQGVAPVSSSSPCLSSLARSQELLSLAVYGPSLYSYLAHSIS